MVKKKEKETKVDNELDFSDLEGMDIDDTDFGDFETVDADRSPSKAGLAKEMTKEASKGFFDGLIKQTAKKTLPEEYTHNYSDAMDYVDFTKETFDVNKSKINKSVYRLGKEVKKLLPFQSKLLDSYLKRQESEFDEYQAQSEEAMRDSSIQSNLSGIFDRQLEVQKALEIKHDAEKEIETRERISNNKMSMDVLSSIDASSTNLTAFTLQIGKEYYRRSLELQFKSYFIQADMLKTMRDNYKAFSLQFDSIIKNTGLPEFVKLHNDERIKDYMRSQVVQSTYKKVFDNNKYVAGIRDKVGKLISEKVEGFTDKFDTISDQLDMLNSAGEEGSGSRILSGILASMGGSTLGEKLSDKFSPKFKDKIKNNKTINTGANYLSMLGNSPSTLFSMLKNKADKKKEEYSDESSPGRFFASKMFGGVSELLGVTAPDKIKDEVKDGSILDHNKAAIFDNKVHRSITEVIPMYLAKMLRENTSLRQLYSTVNSAALAGKKDDTKELHYDYGNRELVTKDELITNVEKGVLSNTTSKNKLSNATNSLLSSSKVNLAKAGTPESKADLKLLSNKKSEKKLNAYLENMSRSDKIAFDYKTLIENYDKESITKEAVSKDPELKKLLDVLKNAKANSSDKRIDERLDDVKRRYPIMALKTTLNDTSKLAESKIVNTLNNKDLTVLSKAFTEFITNKGRDIIPDNIISCEAFSELSEEDFARLRLAISTFIFEVKAIINARDPVKESSLGVLLGGLNRSLRERFELDPEVFQKLRDLSPLLAKKGKLTTENLIEGKLFGKDDTQKVNVAEIRSAVKTSKFELQEKNADVAKSSIMSMLDTIGTKVGTFKEDLKAAGTNPYAISRAVLNNAKDVGSLITAETKKVYDKTSAAVSKLEKAIGDFKDETLDKSVNSLTKQLKNVSDAVTENINRENSAKEERLRTIKSSIDALEGTINDPKVKASLEKDLERTKKVYEDNIKTLTKFRNIIDDKYRKLTQLKNTEENSGTTLVLAIRSELNDALGQFNRLLNEVEFSNSQIKAPA